MKNKYIFLGDMNSVNVEIIAKSYPLLKGKLKYILLGNIYDLKRYLLRIRSKLKINEILNPLDFGEFNERYINIFNIENNNSKKYKNLLNQLTIANTLSNITKYDLVTMPINKEVFKKHIRFIGLTEYLGEINRKKTLMLMHGEKFSIIPFTTHINPKYVSKNLKNEILNKFIKNLQKMVIEKRYNLNFKYIKFLCYNPHCGENNKLGDEDNKIKKLLSKFKNIKGPYPADSAFVSINRKTLFISTYHDQALIPFKALNDKGINMTLGLDYRRISPAHGTALDIKYKNISDNTSYIECMKI
ncbi:MAG: 4-hydroxythreonine-4-phosphate dehydrogenase PdxA [Alphaproteobacteria bacterium]